MSRSICRILCKAAILLASSLGLLSIIASGQTDPIEKGWKGILPLQSTRADVEKAFGKHFRIEPEGHHSYKTDDFVIQVNYVPGPCLPNPYNKAKVNAPAGTVLDTWIYLNKLILISDLNFNRAGYQRIINKEDSNDISYVSSEAGITIGAMIFPDKKENVVTITYRPTEKSKARFACPD